MQPSGACTRGREAGPRGDSRTQQDSLGRSPAHKGPGAGRGDRAAPDNNEISEQHEGLPSEDSRKTGRDHMPHSGRRVPSSGGTVKHQVTFGCWGDQISF